ncbi:MAG: TauD/TfdA family dioxygenase [Nostoc sp.]|uniref:TauD/TfdA family dioxygenase n=1 Tax=Nostoc sp. TaxID=1180 RepID=UPI002FF585E6
MSSQKTNKTKNFEQGCLFDAFYDFSVKGDEVRKLTNNNGKTFHYLIYILDCEEKNVLLKALENPFFDKEFSDSIDFLVKTASQLSPKIKPQIPNLIKCIQGLTKTGNIQNNNCNLLIIKNLPKVFHLWRIETLLGSLAGNIQHYPEEGSHIMAIRENPQDLCIYPSYQNLIDFSAHTDLSYVDNPPNIMAVHYINDDPRTSGCPTFCEAKTIAAILSNSAKRELKKNNFRFTPPQHYQGAASKAIPILSYEDSYGWSIRFRRDRLEYVNKTQLAVNAVNELLDSIHQSLFKLKIPEGSFIFINNQTLLHGREGYKKESVQRARHLNRMYITSEKTIDL